MKCLNCKHYQEYYDEFALIENECKVTGDCYFSMKNDCKIINDDMSINHTELSKVEKYL